MGWFRTMAGRHAKHRAFKSRQVAKYGSRRAARGAQRRGLTT